MSDQPPPPKPKPGSLRDRIAAFEKPSSAPLNASPPVPRPKTGSVSWKAKTQSPPSSPQSSTDHGNTPEKKVLGSISVSDAKESIKGGSLKERMAALQGKGGFGAPPPLSPKPAQEKPKWKPPPAVSPPSNDEKDENEAEPASDKVPLPAESAADHVTQDTHDDGTNVAVEDDDPEEQERQRRAAIAARMARLGGARVGMAPPVFGKKPSIKKMDTPKEESKEEDSKPLETVVFDSDSSVKPAPAEQISDVVEAEQTPDSFPARQNSASSSVLSAESTSSSQTARMPSSMPMPTGPRRAAPPRKKVVKSASPVPELQILETGTQDSLKIASADTSQDHGGEDTHEDNKESVTESPVREKLADDTLPKVVEGTDRVTGERQSDDNLMPEESVDAHTDVLVEESYQEAPLSVETGTGSQSVEAHEGVVFDDESKTTADSAPIVPEAAEALSADPEEEDETTRRKRVAERLTKMGAYNPLSAPRRHSSVIQEGSVGSGGAPSPSHSPTIPRRASLRKESIDSVSSKSYGPERELRKSSLDFNMDRPNVLPPPPRAENLRASSVDSANDGPEYNVLNEEKESQDEFEGLGDKHELATSYEEYELREQHVADKEALQGVLEHDHEHESSVAVSNEWEVNEESSSSNDDPTDTNRGHYNDQADDSENDTSNSQITRVPPPRPAVDTRQNIAPVHDEPLRPPPVVSQSSTGSFVSVAPQSARPLQEHDEQHADKGSTPPPLMRHVPPRRVIAEEQSAPESEAEPARPSRSFPPPARILPHSPEDDYQSESEPRPIPLPRSSRLSLPRLVPSQSEGNSPSDTESVASSRPRRSIPPPPTANEGQNLPDDDASQEAEETPDVKRAEEILPTPPRRPLPSHQDVSHARKTTLDYETEELMATISAPSVRRAIPPTPSPQTQRVAPSSLYGTLPSVSVEGHEVLDESEGDPIDPAFHSPSRRGSPVNTTPPDPALEESVEIEEDSDITRRRTIADRMAKLRGIQFGAPPALGRTPVQRIEENIPEVPAKEVPSEAAQTEEEEEVARKQRIAAKLASMGGQRFGMLPSGPSGGFSQQPRLKPTESTISSQHTVPPPPLLRAIPPSRPAPAPQILDSDSEYDSMPSDEGGQVEAEENELEEFNDENAQDAQDAQDDDETPPPVPTRAGRSESRTEQPQKVAYSPVTGGRPPVPAVPPNFLARRASAQSTVPRQRGSVGSGSSLYQGPSTSTVRPPSFIMADEPEGPEREEAPPTPPARPTSRVPPSRGAPPVPNTTDIAASQWELPAIPVSSLDFGDRTVDLSLSSWTEVVPSAPPSKPTSSSSGGQLPPPVTAGGPPVDAQLSADDLIAIWGRVGVQICEVATTLYEKSRKSLVGDGSYHGFVDAVLSQVPNAALPSPPAYGYVVYVQVGSAVQKRASEIMPGDIVMLSDAKFKGHKGIQTYHQNVGVEEPLVGIVNEFEPKKSKIKVFEANQHVGQQTVESVSYRLEDLKSGTVKVFRALEA